MNRRNMLGALAGAAALTVPNGAQAKTDGQQAARGARGGCAYLPGIDTVHTYEGDDWLDGHYPSLWVTLTEAAPHPFRLYVTYFGEKRHSLWSAYDDFDAGKVSVFPRVYMRVPYDPKGFYRVQIMYRDSEDELTEYIDTR